MQSSATGIYIHLSPVYLCGHPSETVKVPRTEGQDVQSIISPVTSERSQTQLTYTLEHCLPCAISLHDQHRRLGKEGKDAWLRSMAAYQGQVMRLDRGVLREAKSGFEVKLRQLSQVDCSEIENEEDWGAAKGGGSGDGVSVQAVTFLDGRREVELPLPFTEKDEEAPELLRSDGAETESSDESLSLHDDDDKMDDHWEGHQRKDCGREDNKSVDATPNEDGQTHAQLEELKVPNEHIPSDPPVSPISPFTLGQNEDLDWLRLSFLLRNDQLSFDDIADLVTRTTGDGSTPKSLQQKSLTVILPHVHNVGSPISSGRPGKPSQIFEHDVSPLEEEPLRPFSNFIGRLERELEAKELNDDKDGDETVWTINVSPALQKCIHFYNGLSRERTQSCFSSDSSLCTAEDDDAATKARAWWKPKRKLESIQGCERSQEHTVKLWKRGSKSPTRPLNEKELMEKVERKLQARRAASVQPDEGRALLERNSDTHSSLRDGGETESSTRIFTAMRNSGVPTNTIGGNPRKSTSTTPLVRTGINRPYKPSPLKHVTRVTSMDINKSLPPLPLDRQIMVRQASRVSLKEVFGVRKIAVKRVLNEFVGEMAKAY